MTRKERLMATLRGEEVDRPPVCFYELNGLDQDPTDPDGFNIYNDPSWLPLIKLTREKTDRIVLRHVPFKNAPKRAIDQLTTIQEYYTENGDLCQNIKVQMGDRILTKRTRHEKDVDTVWVLDHLIKNVEDFTAWINLPLDTSIGEPDISSVLDAEEALGDSGIVCIDIGDPLCEVAELFEMGDYTIMAMLEPELFHKALVKVSRRKLKEVEAIAKALPNRLWRIYGPEYACPPYLPPRLFKEYVADYDKPMIDIIKKYGGFPRIHAHGNIKDVLDHIVSTGCIGLDPVEPPTQGDVTLKYVREKYGKDLVLFGNLELSDMESMEPDIFEKKVMTALEDGTSGTGKGFVLMPSASPIGRKLKNSTYKNYEKIIEVVERLYK